MVAVNLVGEVEVEGSRLVVVGCREEEVEMETRGQVHWAVGVLLRKQKYHVSIDDKFNKFNKEYFRSFNTYFVEKDM